MRAAKSMKYAKSKAAPSTSSFGGKLALPFAKKKKPEAIASVEGSPAKQRLDRPGRKVGGQVEQQGGREVSKDRLSEDSKIKAAKAQKDADHSRFNRNIMGGASGAFGVLGSVGNKLQRSGNKPAALITGLGALGSHFTSKDKSAEAASILRKEPISGEEDRKAGGRVKKR